VAKAELLLFAGPSAHGLDLAALLHPADCCLPPVQRGDVWRALKRRRRPGVMLLCDGRFDQVPAVSHAELCAALDAGWQLWGCSSLGAIRAWELRGEGMQGFGWVYAQFSRYADFTDDEMALLHGPAPDWLPLTVPLVELRWALERHAAALNLDGNGIQRLLAPLRQRWFGDRSPAAVASCLAHALSPVDAQAVLGTLRRERIKQRDLVSLLQQRPWQVSLPRPGPGVPPPPAS
jgi:hypothetical protein